MIGRVFEVENLSRRNPYTLFNGRGVESRRRIANVATLFPPSLEQFTSVPVITSMKLLRLSYCIHTVRQHIEFLTRLNGEIKRIHIQLPTCRKAHIRIWFQQFKWNRFALPTRIRHHPPPLIPIHEIVVVERRKTGIHQQQPDIGLWISDERNRRTFCPQTTIPLLLSRIPSAPPLQSFIERGDTILIAICDHVHAGPIRLLPKPRRQPSPRILPQQQPQIFVHFPFPLFCV